MLNIVKTNDISKYCRIFAVQTINNNKTMNKKNNGKNATANESANVQTNVQVTDQNKVTAKVAIKSISRVAAYVRAERKGVNATIRILMETAASGDLDAINTLCALCDVPTDMISVVTLDNVRQAVNAHYPYIVVTDDGRKINVRAKSVHYTTAASAAETQDDARKRVSKGYYSAEVTDYLVALTSAARARAKGQQQIVVDAAKVYDDNKLTTIAGVTVEDIKQAIERKIFSYAAVNVWHKNNIFGYYI